MSMSHVGGKLSTYGEFIGYDGRRINLGQMDRKVGIKIEFFGKLIDLTFRWTPRLWYYKYVTYPRRIKLMNKEK